MPPSTAPPSLQSQLDAITAQTRALVQPERLAIVDASIHDLLLSGIESRILPVGAPAPSFALPAASPTALSPSAPATKLVRSADLLALGPVILNFFRGRWCPYCVTELEAWQSSYADLRARGALLVAISPQLPRQNDFLVQQHSLTFPVLSDPGCRLAEAFGIAYTIPQPMQAHFRSILVNIPFVNGDQGKLTWRLPLPATFVIKPTINREGVVAFAEAHADHRVRPDPLDVLRIL
ncbi:MAG TPA: peroxiredoxin-like family protein [Acidobacteriaceae bacterium]|nr:peroxiredoxin-like family protein [Acidobacteriaceae bacterium]